MPIYYALFENNLTSDPNDYAAHVQITSSVDLDGLAQRMIEQGSTVTKPDILAVLEDAIKASESLLVEGYRINIGGLCDLFPRIVGIFNGSNDNFDPARHYVDAGSAIGARIRKALQSRASVERLEATKPKLALAEFLDQASGERNSIVSPGNIGILYGHRLKYDVTKPEEGLFFINTASGVTTKVTQVPKNKPAELFFLIPTLDLAEYWLEVRARVQGGGDLRIGRLDATLIVP